MPEPILCYRCGKPGHVDWHDIRTLGEVEPRYEAGRQYCLTDGCTDEDGSRRLVALTPAELRGRADAAWMAHQRALTEDR